ncbi:unnamed protein product [Discosporangium mesarthrocarpum]
MTADGGTAEGGMRAGAGTGHGGVVGIRGGASRVEEGLGEREGLGGRRASGGGAAKGQRRFRSRLVEAFFHAHPEELRAVAEFVVGRAVSNACTKALSTVVRPAIAAALREARQGCHAELTGDRPGGLVRWQGQGQLHAESAAVLVEQQVQRVLGTRAQEVAGVAAKEGAESAMLYLAPEELPARVRQMAASIAGQHAKKRADGRVKEITGTEVSQAINAFKKDMTKEINDSRKASNHKQPVHPQGVGVATASHRSDQGLSPNPNPNPNPNPAVLGDKRKTPSAGPDRAALSFQSGGGLGSSPQQAAAIGLDNQGGHGDKGGQCQHQHQRVGPRSQHRGISQDLASSGSGEQCPAGMSSVIPSIVPPKPTNGRNKEPRLVFPPSLAPSTPSSCSTILPHAKDHQSGDSFPPFKACPTPPSEPLSIASALMEAFHGLGGRGLCPRAEVVLSEQECYETRADNVPEAGVIGCPVEQEGCHSLSSTSLEAEAVVKASICSILTLPWVVDGFLGPDPVPQEKAAFLSGGELLGQTSGLIEPVPFFEGEGWESLRNPMRQCCCGDPIVSSKPVTSSLSSSELPVAVTAEVVAARARLFLGLLSRLWGGFSTATGALVSSSAEAEVSVLSSALRHASACLHPSPQPHNGAGAESGTKAMRGVEGTPIACRVLERLVCLGALAAGEGITIEHPPGAFIRGCPPIPPEGPRGAPGLGEDVNGGREDGKRMEEEDNGHEASPDTVGGALPYPAQAGPSVPTPEEAHDTRVGAPSWLPALELVTRGVVSPVDAENALLTMLHQAGQGGANNNDMPRGGRLGLALEQGRGEQGIMGVFAGVAGGKDTSGDMRLGGGCRDDGGPIMVYIPGRRGLEKVVTSLVREYHERMLGIDLLGGVPPSLEGPMLNGASGVFEVTVRSWLSSLAPGDTSGSSGCEGTVGTELYPTEEGGRGRAGTLPPWYHPLQFCRLVGLINTSS